MKDRLIEEKLRVAVIISTDGEPTDGDIAESMKPLQDLPVWIVVRICTDDDVIVKYWNEIDEHLELEIDVLDDFSAEAAEVDAVNSWLTYGQPMHALREFGAIIKECDILDEATLSTEQMHVVAAILLGTGSVRSFGCHPDADWTSFIQTVHKGNNNRDFVYDPLRKKMLPWINIPNLCKVYNKPNPLKSAACVIC